MKLIATFLITFIFFVDNIPASDTSSIHVKVHNLKNNKGVVLLRLYKSKKGFPGKPEFACKVTSGAISGNMSNLEFNNIPSGTYAISMIHDENNNGEMDKNWLGIPKEGVGASNNSGKFGPPKFKSSSFEVLESTVTLNIKPIYF
jgi:uncharacterized protein (DUF2141 family)